MYGEFVIIKRISLFFALLFYVVCSYAADDPVVATKSYVDDAISTNSATLAQTIANAVQNINSTISTLQPVSDKTTVVNASSTDVQYPSAKAVYTMVQNDPRFNSLPSTAPVGNPPTGRFYIWIEN
jgi:hypothetical protein